MLIRNDACSDDCLNRRATLVNILKLLMVLPHDSIFNSYIDTHRNWRVTRISQATCLRKGSILRPWPFCWAERDFTFRASDSSTPQSQNFTRRHSVADKPVIKFPWLHSNNSLYIYVYIYIYINIYINVKSRIRTRDLSVLAAQIRALVLLHGTCPWLIVSGMGNGEGVFFIVMLSLWLYFNLLTHCGRVTQICVFTLQLCRTGDSDLRF